MITAPWELLALNVRLHGGGARLKPRGLQRRPRMQYPGNSTITFNFPGVTPDRLNNMPSQASSSFTQVGCAMQPVTVKDDLDNTVYSYATDKCIAPPTTNTESVTAEWYLSFNDASFRVLG